MNKRPVAIVIIAGLFLFAGVAGIVHHARDFTLQGPVRSDLIWVCLTQLAAIIGGVFLLRACNWARWLVLAWMAFHVVLSAFHSLTQLLVHGALLAVIAFFLLTPAASAYFRRAKASGSDE